MRPFNALKQARANLNAVCLTPSCEWSGPSKDYHQLAGQVICRECKQCSLFIVNPGEEVYGFDLN